MKKFLQKDGLRINNIFIALALLIFGSAFCYFFLPYTLSVFGFNVGNSFDIFSLTSEHIKNNIIMAISIGTPVLLAVSYAIEIFIRRSNSGTFFCLSAIFACFSTAFELTYFQLFSLSSTFLTITLYIKYIFAIIAFVFLVLGFIFRKYEKYRYYRASTLHIFSSLIWFNLALINCLPYIYSISIIDTIFKTGSLAYFGVLGILFLLMAIWTIFCVPHRYRINPDGSEPVGKVAKKEKQKKLSKKENSAELKQPQPNAEEKTVTQPQQNAGDKAVTPPPTVENTGQVAQQPTATTDAKKTPQMDTNAKKEDNAKKENISTDKEIETNDEIERKRIVLQEKRLEIEEKELKIREAKIQKLEAKKQKLEERKKDRLEKQIARHQAKIDAQQERKKRWQDAIQQLKEKREQKEYLANLQKLEEKLMAEKPKLDTLIDIDVVVGEKKPKDRTIIKDISLDGVVENIDEKDESNFDKKDVNFESYEKKNLTQEQIKNLPRNISVLLTLPKEQKDLLQDTKKNTSDIENVSIVENQESKFANIEPKYSAISNLINTNNEIGNEKTQIISSPEKAKELGLNSSIFDNDLPLNVNNKKPVKEPIIIDKFADDEENIEDFSKTTRTTQTNNLPKSNTGGNVPPKLFVPLPSKLPPKLLQKKLEMEKYQKEKDDSEN